MITRHCLKQQISLKHCLRVLEVHSPLSAMISERITIKTETQLKKFYAFWSSSLSDSTLRGLPDTEVLNLRNRMATIREILDVTTLPLIVDGDTGGHKQHFSLNVAMLERNGEHIYVVGKMVKK
ncbi:isocitrate lyase/phosphoenolpyruvate mutase family protein [Bartonella doshiae]|uniref:Phosphoenolpyruvate phosphomutase n=2 Tax=Bartonella doshiae TaxID=33044 RepID=A0A380ZBR9_BARDO|nr:isocitrate lyase/phosphoenolpyruvate mutase family protein [Bartonella doshiae]EJF81300.1 hypothetical protein MCS_00574 [Bartonella doshiae NCTC 12862 = ATCC 700133]MBB6159144.1 phosphoenolpyruvate phosphomutase [Bartonella doshiae]SUV44427.1 phosphoenolpyruvate phosphomutase [Bartonella doshiae]